MTDATPGASTRAPLADPPAEPSAAAEPAQSTGRAARTPRPARREMTIAILLALAGAALVLAVAGRTWADGTVAVQGTRIAVDVSGNTISKATSALALLGAAGALAVFATRTFGRVVVGALITIAGVGVTAFAVDGARDRSALDSQASGKAAIEGAHAIGVGHSIWPWFAAVGGVLILLAGLLTLARGRRWPGLSNRYEAPTGKRVAPAGVHATNADLWNAMDRGEDPTH